MFSSPLRGISISTKGDKTMVKRYLVFVPSTGYLYFYNCGLEYIAKMVSFRPLFGVSLFLQLWTRVYSQNG